ncbi:MAG: hydrolase [Alphaproteobacteria bacterium]|jgi:nicotinamidase-related amidase|nr:hydrolase [Alphaproteobacteria bacterium]
MLIDSRHALLLLVDLQERLMPAMHEPGQVIANSLIMLTVAGKLGIPTVVTEQYPQGLGHTVPEIGERLAAREAVYPKMTFSAAADPAVMARLRQSRRMQVVLAGVEAHVCVTQTAIGLAQAGYQPFVVADAITSRKPQSVQLALERLRQNGVSIVSTEMVLFELLGRAGTEEFRELSRLIR